MVYETDRKKGAEMPVSDVELTEHTLGNGLRVVVSEDHLTPTTAVNIWYDVGSRHEVAGRTGLAHLFEHLMFQGSANVASGDHLDHISGAGGILNATTHFDRTNYFETVPGNALELALWLEADRMGSLLDALTQENLDNQRDVVKNERRQRFDNQPYGTVWERLHELCFPPGHPYAHLPIGSMADLDAATLQDVRDFFSMSYAPNNAVLTIVGAVETEAALEAVQRYFGSIQPVETIRGARSGAIGPIEQEVRLELREPVPAEAFYAQYRLPADGTPECDAADLAFGILGVGQASRLYDRLVRREELATSVMTHVQRLVGGVSTGALVAHARAGVALKAVEEAIDDELARFVADGPTEHELARIAAQAERQSLRQLETVADRADHLSRYATLFGAPALALEEVDRWLVVRAEDVQAIAAQTMRPANRAVVTYHLDGSNS